MTTTRTRGSFDVRSVDADEYGPFHATLMRAFGADQRPEDLDLWRQVIELHRTSAVYDGATPVGVAGIFSFTMTVPGTPAQVTPVAGVTHVGVLPTHRRRGILGALMTDQIVGLHERANGAGEPIAALFASEPGIYGRYGYGLSTYRASLTIDTATASFIDSAARAGRPLRLVPVEDARPSVMAVYDEVRRAIPGHFARSAGFWRRRWNDSEYARGGMSAMTCVIADGPEGPVGYALYRTKVSWDDNDRPSGTVSVLELAATDDDTYADLWRFVLDIDLVTTATVGLRPPGDPLLLLLRDIRGANVRTVDGMWVRVIDVDRGLAARGYATEVDLVLDVIDTRCPWNAGRWRLLTGPTGATCERTNAAPDLSVDIRALGAAYFGATPLSSLAAAGLVAEHRTGALPAATTAFRGDVEPWCPEIF